MCMSSPNIPKMPAPPPLPSMPEPPPRPPINPQQTTQAMAPARGASGAPVVSDAYTRRGAGRSMLTIPLDNGLNIPS